MFSSSYTLVRDVGGNENKETPCILLYKWETKPSTKSVCVYVHMSMCMYANMLRYTYTYACECQCICTFIHTQTYKCIYLGKLLGC